MDGAYPCPASFVSQGWVCVAQGKVQTLPCTKLLQNLPCGKLLLIPSPRICLQCPGAGGFIASWSSFLFILIVYINV